MTVSFFGKIYKVRSTNTIKRTFSKFKDPNRSEESVSVEIEMRFADL
jgi:hypothetical protein